MVFERRLKLRLMSVNRLHSLKLAFEYSAERCFYPRVCSIKLYHLLNFFWLFVILLKRVYNHLQLTNLLGIKRSFAGFDRQLHLSR